MPKKKKNSAPEYGSPDYYEKLFSSPKNRAIKAIAEGIFFCVHTPHKRMSPEDSAESKRNFEWFTTVYAALLNNENKQYLHCEKCYQAVLSFIERQPKQ